MIQQHNRKSYLAPPAPKAINRDGSRDSPSHQEPSEKSNKSPRPPPPPSRHSKPQTPQLQQSQQKHVTPTSGEIPVNFSRDSESSSRNRIAVDTPGSSLGLEHLTTKDQRPKTNRNPSSYSSTNGSSNSSGTRSGATTSTTSPQTQYTTSAHTNNNNTTNTNVSMSPIEAPQYSSRSAPSPYHSKPRVGPESAGFPTSAGGRPVPPPTGPLPVPPPRSAGTSGWRGKDPQGQGQGHRHGSTS